MSRAAITVDDIGKAYQIGHQRQRSSSIRDAVTGVFSRALRRFREPGGGDATTETFWALRNISFEINPGEVVGIIGRNGAGKSTLLKVLSRITEPTEGVARIRGRLASLLEVGTGFHPELTGRENIYLNGSILGMKKAEIDRKFDEIVAFAEVEKFLDTQVKHYSSGMYVRLAFAVAAHLETQILVIDEVLAVGDVGFQNKCLGRIEEVTREGRTVFFVSHNVPAVQNLCTRCILLEQGRLQIDGDPTTVLALYSKRAAASTSSRQDLEQHPGRTPDSRPCLRRVTVRADGGGDDDFIRMGDDIAVEIEFRSEPPLTDVYCRAYVRNNLNMPVFGFDTNLIPPAPLLKPIRRGRLICRSERVPLMPGTYTLDLYFGSHNMYTDVVHDACRFEIHPADVFGSGNIPHASAGSVYWPGAWEVEDEEAVAAAARRPA